MITTICLCVPHRQVNDFGARVVVCSPIIVVYRNQIHTSCYSFSTSYESIPFYKTVSASHKISHKVLILCGPAYSWQLAGVNLGTDIPTDTHKHTHTHTHKHTLISQDEMSMRKTVKALINFSIYSTT